MVFGVDGLAYLLGTFTLAQMASGNTQLTSFKGKNVWILKRQADGAWKIAADIWNDNEPPPQQGESASGN